MKPRYGIHDGLNLRPDDAQTHLDALETLGITEDYAQQLQFLYENLNILDNKAASLLSFNAIGLASLAIWLANIPSSVIHLTLDVAWLLFLVSCGFCLKIAWLHWVSTEDLLDAERHAVVLVRHRDDRTISYRRAWWLSTVAVVITGLASVCHTVGVAIEAFG